MEKNAYLKGLLETLGFVQNEDTWIFSYPDSSSTITVDMNKEEILYPEDKGFTVNERQTCNFSDPENFVVLECVHRLLLKGYLPQHIELERRWTLGHTQKGGRADVCVMNETGTDTLFIIECKTYGKEYEKALKDLKQDGGQLFSYLQQDKATKWLCLYASRCRNEKIEQNIKTVFSSDDEQILALSTRDTSIKTFHNAKTVEQSFSAWIETYEQKLHGDLIFSDDTVAYQIGIKPLRKKDLKEFNPQDKIVNQFEEILRHNNVSDKENAFNKLLALFICKLVDEIQKGEDDIVDFQYKQGTDTYETLQDRLQRLHKEGMDKFMREEVFYVSNEYPQQLFEQYKGANRKHAINELKETFRKLKFYSNNDFAFKEVHNEELFLQNGKILVEMVRLFENYRIIYSGKHQFLGDLFEQLLNKGFKQNEGQFFTPTPITRFMWESLPLEELITASNGSFPKVVDYACGAGHFLTEGIEVINQISTKNNNNSWVKDHIFGIEKDYRLARVSKIALFMNGAGEGNIIFGDGLENDNTRGVTNGAFTILVANPPYSVKAFKSHLQLKNNELSLLERISNDGGEIEVLFVERIAQLLKPGGVAAVVLPYSILSNNSGSYIGAREILLRNFQIKAIAQFGSKTFGATGTNTVVLFLSKNIEPPKKDVMIEDSINNIFNGDPSEEWPDKEILDSYASYIGIDRDLYVAFVTQQADLDALKNEDYFKLIIDAFYLSSAYKDKVKKRQFKSLNKNEQDKVLRRTFYSYALPVEREKLFYYALVKDQKTLISIAPSTNTEQKQFLGYDWSNRKGNEGIQISRYGGMLFDPDNRNSVRHISSYIRKSFSDACPPINKNISSIVKVIDTKNMLNFAPVDFNKTLTISAVDSPTEELISKYPLTYLKDHFTMLRGVTYKKDQQSLSVTANKILTADNISLDNILNINKTIYLNEGFELDPSKKLSQNDIFMCFSSGSKKHLGKSCFIANDLDYYAGGFMGIIRESTGSIKSEYLHKLLSTQIYKILISNLSAGGNIQNLSSKLGEMRIPMPPIDIQQQIIDSCKKVEQKYLSTRMQIEDYRKQIQDIFEQLDVVKISGGGYRLSDESIFTLSIGKRVVNSELTDEGIPVYSANVFEPVGLIDRDLLKDFEQDSVIWGIDGDWMVNLIEKGNAFYPTDHCGVLRCDETKVNPLYLSAVLEKAGVARRFTRSYRASLDRIREISFDAPSIEDQNRLMDTIKGLKQRIAELEKDLPDLKEEFSRVINEYLV